MSESTHTDPILFSLFLIFSGAAVLATLALYARQALPIAYIALGLLIGPHGAAIITDPDLIRQMSQIGIIFLLFLLGLDLTPQDLLHLLRKATLVTLGGAAVFAFTGFAIASAFGFGTADSLLIGAAMIFSSTIIGLKLLPTTALHHQHAGELIISVLLLQDLLAIAILLVIGGSGGGEAQSNLATLVLLLALPALAAFAYLCERYVLIPLIRMFSKIREYVFLIAIGWCLGMAELASLLGLSHEIGAFIGGVALARSPIALYIADSLRPLRDFFLVLFFFSLGAGFDLGVLPMVALPAICLAAAMMLLKPLTFKTLLQWTGEPATLAKEVGARLGQASEFSLLIAVLALEQAVIGKYAAYVVQATTLLTFIASTYYVVLNYPTPVAVSDKLRRD